MIRITVPASTANLGPGFDSLGCALSLYAKFDCERIDSGLWIEGCEEKYRNADNLFVRAFRAAEQAMGASEYPIHLIVHTDVPDSRGLGSSATFTVAGVLAANALHGNPLSQEECLSIAVHFEGHPDNIAPAMLGGLRASFMQAGAPITIDVPIAQNVGFIALIPNFETRTSDMRRVLPEKVSRGDAIFNLSRVAVLQRAIEIGNLNMIAKALEDRLHQPYRIPLIPEYNRAQETALQAGASAFCISGSGSTCLAIADNAQSRKIAAQIRTQLADSSYQWRIIPLEPDRIGAYIEEK